METLNLLDRILELTAPWRVLHVRDDIEHRQIDIWIGTEVSKRGWLFERRSEASAGHEHVWRHINLATMRCVIHANLRPEEISADLPCFGEVGLPFTHALASQVVTQAGQGMSLQRLCHLFDVHLDDLWKYHHRLAVSHSESEERQREPVDTLELSAEQRLIPGPDDAIWEKLLDGSATIDIQAPELCNFLTKIRDEVHATKNEKAHIIRSHELRRYFIRNEKLLTHELSQLRELSQPSCE